MTCYAAKIGESTAIICTSNRQRPRRCKFCDRPADRLCDFPIPRHERAKKDSPTCDAPLCQECAHKIGLDSDLCPPHAARWGNRK